VNVTLSAVFIASWCQNWRRFFFNVELSSYCGR